MLLGFVHCVQGWNFHDLKVSEQCFAVLFLDTALLKQDIDHDLIIEPARAIHAVFPCAMTHAHKKINAIPAILPNLDILCLVDCGDANEERIGFWFFFPAAIDIRRSRC